MSETTTGNCSLCGNKVKTDKLHKLKVENSMIDIYVCDDCYKNIPDLVRVEKQRCDKTPHSLS